MRTSFEFKGISSDSFDMVVSFLDRRQIPEEKIDVYEIPMRAETLVKHTGVFTPYVRNVECILKDTSQKMAITAWLRGSGILRTSIDPNGFFRANIISTVQFEKYGTKFEKLTFQFLMNPPYYYFDTGMAAIEDTTSPMGFTNPGNIESNPIIDITGSGNITLDVNGKVITLTAVDSYISLDSELQVAYKDTVNQGDKMVGEFPVLIPGVNAISWTGTVTKVRVLPRWVSI